VECVFRSGNDYIVDVQQKLEEKFPDITVPHHNTMKQVTDKFHENGTAVDEPRSAGRPSIPRNLITRSMFFENTISAV